MQNSLAVVRPTDAFIKEYEKHQVDLSYAYIEDFLVREIKRAAFLECEPLYGLHFLNVDLSFSKFLVSPLGGSILENCNLYLTRFVGLNELESAQRI